MTVLKEVLAEVLKEVRPSKEEEKDVMSKVDKFIKKINSKLSKIKNVDIILGGSGAKGTWLKNTFDIDLFVRFDRTYKDKDISSILEKVLKSFKCERYHGSRDYFRVNEDGFVYEVVPVIKITKSKEALNLTDVSPLHSIWVKKNTDEKLKDEIRLSKKFFKANNMYGAESHIKGFSGYVLEILTIKYGSFLNLLKASLKWKEKQVIDIAKFHKDVFFEVNSSKLESPLIVIDPVQAGRNASAALSLEKFNDLKKVAKDFITTPLKKFFDKEKLDITKLKKNNIVLEAEAFEGKEDIVGCKIDKAVHFINQNLEKNEFVVKKSGWIKENKLILYFELEKNKLPSEQTVFGPPAKMEFHANEFRKKYKNVSEKEGKLVAVIKREYPTPEPIIDSIKNADYLKDKVKNLKLI